MIERLALLVMLFPFGNAGAQGIISLDPQADDGITIKTNSLIEFSGNLNISEFKLEEQETPEGIFSRLSAPGYTRTYNYGHPEMPAYRKLIRVPLGAEAEVRILSSSYTDIDLEAEGYAMPVYPSQPPRSKNLDEHEFVIDHAAYQLKGFESQERLSVDMLGILRDKRIARINFRPFEYDAAQHMLRVYHSIEFSIRFIDADIPATLALEEKFASPSFISVNNSLINTNENPSRENFKSYPVKYVIISDRMFESQLQDFITWKTKKGFLVVESYTDEAAVGNSLQSIKSYLQGLYNAGTSEDPAPSYVLFVGDIQQIPTYDNGDGATDRNYVEYTGDLFPEIYYGRMSAQNPVQLQPYIDKTLQYEKYTMPDPSYLDEVVMIAGADASHGYDWGNGQINYGTINYFNEDHGITSHTYLYPQSGSSSAAIQQDISNGVTFGNYTAHCSPNGWADPSFTISDIANLQNQDKYGLLIGNCCSSSEYQQNECFGEAIVRAENKGAVGYIGASNSTYWDEDYYFGVGVGEISQNPPSYFETGLGNYDRSFHDHGEEFSEWYVSGDEIIFAGNLAVSESGSSLEQYYWDVYNYMGDPSLMVYYSNPPETTADYAPLLPLQSTEFIVNTHPYAYVALSLNGEYIGAALADADGLAVLEFPPLNDGGNADVVVTRQNGQPFFGEVVISSPSGPYLIIENVAVGDENGNDNGFADFGESIDLEVTLDNVGNGDAENTVSILVGDDNYLEITKDEHLWPTIPGQSQLTEEGVFSMTIADDVPDQHTVVFDIEIESPTKEIWTYGYELVINAPVLTIGGMIVDDSQYGNDNGRLDPGETATLKVINRNTGHCETHNTEAQLSSMSQYLSFTSNSYSIGTLGLLGYKYAEFEVSVDPDAPDGAAIAEFDYSVTSGEYSASKIFSKKIGLIVEDFETGDFTKFDWEMGGDLPWQISNYYPYEGMYSAKSGAITDNQKTELFVDVEVMIADSVSFVYQVSSQQGKDKLKFYINNSLKGEWSGVGAGWNEVAFYIPAGNHTLKWVYEKDASGMSGNDWAYLDYIIFPPLMTLTCYAGSDNYTCEGSSFTCQGEATDWISVEWSTSGDGSFDDPSLLQAVYTPGSDDIANGNVNLTLTAEDLEGALVDDEMSLSIMDAPQAPEMPEGPDYVNLYYTSMSEYTCEPVPYADHYDWSVDPAEAGDISGLGTTGTINWNASYLGTATISVRAINNCGDGEWGEGFDVTVDNTVRVAEINEEDVLKIYPNPSAGMFNVFAREDLQDARISVHSLLGAKVFSFEDNLLRGETINIDLSSQKQGLYILRIASDKFNYTSKLVIR